MRNTLIPFPAAHAFRVGSLVALMLVLALSAGCSQSPEPGSQGTGTSGSAGVDNKATGKTSNGDGTHSADTSDSNSTAAVQPVLRVPVLNLPESPTAATPDESKPETKPDSDDKPTPSPRPDGDKPTEGTLRPEEAKPADPGEARYEIRAEHDPNGIGKFYMGREIAQVMGVAGADWLERPERDEEEDLTKLIASLGLKPGMIVADIGAGTGVLSLRMAERVGDEGKVVAVDVQQEMLDLIAKKTKEKKIDNVELILGTDKNPKLPKDTLDLALMVDVYHEFAHPYEMMRHIADSLKVNGRVVFVEYRKEDPKVPIKAVHKMSEEQVKKEIGLPELSLRYKETIGVLPRQHIIIFERIDPKNAQPGPVLRIN